MISGSRGEGARPARASSPNDEYLCPSRGVEDMPVRLPQLVLQSLPDGVEIVTPAGLQVGDAVPVPPAVQGRWITIGAGPDQDIVLRDQPPGISRSHCRMTQRNGAFLIQGRLHPTGYAING